MTALYKVVGISKQAVHKYEQGQVVFDQKLQELLLEAEELRKEHPGCGVEKMYNTLRPDFIGIDRFIEAFMGLGFRLKRKGNYRRTTYCGPVHYPNIIKGLKVSKPCHIWQSDITYINVGDRFYYAVFIIDVYTKKIVGYQVSDNMRATANIKALEMALATNDAPLIHHSDRGSQYGCKDYVKLLQTNDCKISMALSAQDNAYAERINRTIKEEYIDHWKPQSFDQLKRYVHKAVKQYNQRRPHNNLKEISPEEFENNWKNIMPANKPVMTIFDNESNSKPVNLI